MPPILNIDQSPSIASDLRLLQVESDSLSGLKIATPRQYWRGRPIVTVEELAQMESFLPDEPEWNRE